MHAAVVTYQVQPEKAEEAARLYEESFVPPVMVSVEAWARSAGS
ncbi:hypothetical protein BH20ACT11_BH20ACT11_04810 [soil metagenome]